MYLLKEHYLCQTATEMAQRNRQRRLDYWSKRKN